MYTMARVNLQQLKWPQTHRLKLDTGFKTVDLN